MRLDLLNKHKQSTLDLLERIERSSSRITSPEEQEANKYLFDEDVLQYHLLELMEKRQMYIELEDHYKNKKKMYETRGSFTWQCVARLANFAANAKNKHEDLTVRIEAREKEFLEKFVNK